MDAVSNFPNSLVATAPSPATTGTTLVVTAGQGVLFPAPPFNLVLTAAGAAPSLAASEIVRCTAITTDTLTVTRAQESTTAKTVVAGWQAYATATKNTFSQIPSKSYEAVVASSGGDYTTLGAALAAGARSVFIKQGTYNETTLNTAWSGARALNIVGEDRANTIIQLASATTGVFTLNLPNSYIANLTIKTGLATSLASATTGWVANTGTMSVFERVTFFGSNSTNTGTAVNFGGAGSTMRDCNYTNGSCGNGYMTISTDDITLDSINWSETRNAVNVNSSLIGTGTFVRCKVLNSTFVSSQVSSFVQIISDNSIIDNCNFISTYGQAPTDGSNVLYLSGLNCIISNCVGKTTGKGINIDGTSSQAIGNLISINCNAGSSISIGISTGTIGAQITNNIITGNSNANSYYGISAREGAVIVGNQVSGFSNSGITGSSGGSSFIRCSGNIVSNCAQYYSFTTATNVSFDVVSQFKLVAASTTATTLNFQQYNGHLVTLTSSTTFTFTDEPSLSSKPTQDIFVDLIQDATGGRAATWPATVAWPSGVAPTLSGANKRDKVKFSFDPSTSKYYGIVIAQNF